MLTGEQAPSFSPAAEAVTLSPRLLILRLPQANAQPYFFKLDTAGSMNCGDRQRSAGRGMSA